MTKNSRAFYSVPYVLWLGLFVISPMLLILYQSFFDITGAFTFANYATYFSSGNYLRMTLNSFLYAFIITLVTFLISYPTALFLSRTKHKQLWLSLIILPTWINLLMKAYAFIGLFSQSDTVNQFLGFMGISPQQILFTDFSFIFVAAYIELPFMILPIFNSIEELTPSLIVASEDLGATRMQTLTRVIFPLTLSGVRSGFQADFIPSLSLFMLTRLIGGNRVITLGTAVEQHFLVTQNWGMGSTMLGFSLGFSTLAVKIYSRARRGVSLEINELSALMFLFTLLLVLGYYFIQQYGHNKRAQQLKAIGKRAGSDRAVKHG